MARRTLRAVIISAFRLLLLAAVVVAGTVSTQGPPADAALLTRSGTYEGKYAAPRVAEFERWRGRPVGVVMTFVPNASWEELHVPADFARHWGQSPYRQRMIITLGMLPKSSTSTATLQQGATGAYNGHFRTAARNLVAAGLGRATIRLGHEMNGTWYPWSAVPDPAAYVSYWRQVVTTMRSVPGQAFTFEWNVAIGPTVMDARKAYPGNAYVDYVGQDVYDHKYADPDATPEQRWQHRLVPAYGQYRHGLLFWAEFARLKGKPLSFSEWGLVDEEARMAAGAGGGDAPYFVERMRAWIDSHDVANEVYFDVNAADGKHRLTDPLFPEAAARYRALFGG